MKRILSVFTILVLSVGILLTNQYRTSSLDIPSAPSGGYVIDQAEILSDQEETQLDQQIKTIKDQTSNEIGILTVKDGEGVDPAQFATQVGREWGVGTKENKNGVLILISLQNPKKIQIAVSTGLEGVLTDGLSAKIARNEIAPKFKQSKYYDGLSAGITSISEATKGEYASSDNNPDYTSLKSSEFVITIFIFGLIFLQFLFSVMASSKSWWFGGILGGIGPFVFGSVTGYWWLTVFLLIIFVPLGLLFDYKVSKNYKKHIERKKNDNDYHLPWYFGGGSFGSGSGGGFSGGGFSGGGSFGGGGGGSSW